MKKVDHEIINKHIDKIAYIIVKNAENSKDADVHTAYCSGLLYGAVSKELKEVVSFEAFSKALWKPLYDD
jgi:hypothetical protein